MARDPVLRWIAIGAICMALVPFLVSYLKLARTVDDRLANGPFSRSATVLYAPRAASGLDPEVMTSLSDAREKRRLVRFNEIPPTLVQAVLSAEDKHFFQHRGFDFGRILKAAYVDLKDRRKQEGASTITMQLARALWLDRAKSWRRKVEEMLITAHLEHKLTKQQIFEDYANQVYLGQRWTFSIHGFGEGARVFFGKDLSQISVAEAALLAGLVRRPTYYDPFEYPEKARERRNMVLSLMRHNGYLIDREYREAARTPVRTAPESERESATSYFTSLVSAELRAKLGDEYGRARSIYTTLDPDLQQAAEAAVRIGMENVDRQLGGRRGRHTPSRQPQVALVALDPRTGNIKALVGGRDYATNQINHAVAMRQPGSVFKPFVYTAAMETALEGGPRIFTPASVLHDVASNFYFRGNVYQPHDFGDRFMGDITLRTALAHSLNVATVNLAQDVGYEHVVEVARRAGLNNHIQPTPAVALGAYETTPLEIAAAYTMFANYGEWVRPTTISTVRSQDGAVLYSHEPDTRQALDPRVAFLMVNMLQEVLRSGTGAGVRSRGFTLPAAGKTGTSRDGWFAGFTSELLCVVWVGFDDGSDLKLEGARSALPIWAEFMKRASQTKPYGSVHDFAPPKGVVTVNICNDSGQRATPDCPSTRAEVFIAGSEPATECELHRHLEEHPAVSGGESGGNGTSGATDLAPGAQSATGSRD